MSQKKARETRAPQYSAEIERQRVISVDAAAEFKGISPDSFERHFGHLIRRITPGRRGVMLGDLLTD
jgi:hypothetical protein